MIMKILFVILALLVAAAAYGGDMDARDRHREARSKEMNNHPGQPRQQAGADSTHYKKGRTHRKQNYRQQQENTPRRQNLFYRYDQQQREMRKNKWP